MKGRIILLGCLICVLSCKKEGPPRDVLTRAQMVDWFIDIYLVEARTTALTIPRDSVYKLFVPFEDSLLSKKGIRDSTLIKSYQYYLDHPLEMEAIYDEVIDSLNLREQRNTAAAQH